MPGAIIWEKLSQRGVKRGYEERRPDQRAKQKNNSWVVDYFYKYGHGTYNSPSINKVRSDVTKATTIGTNTEVNKKCFMESQVKRYGCKPFWVNEK